MHDAAANYPADSSYGLTVAIVGADGSGKSTIAKMITGDASLRSKYIYMGASIESSRIALPTSRLLVYLKRRRIGKQSTDSSPLPPSAVMSDEMKSRLRGGSFVKAVGVINRIAEEWYRQFFVWAYKLRGFVVVCDRHFLYEYFPDSDSARSKDRRLSVRLHDGMLSRFFPRPDLTVFLDAPAKILYARKPEWTIEHLNKQRDGIIEQGRAGGAFIRVDATQAIDDVYAQVLNLIGNRRQGTSPHY